MCSYQSIDSQCASLAAIDYDYRPQHETNPIYSKVALIQNFNNGSYDYVSCEKCPL